MCQIKFFANKQILKNIFLNVKLVFKICKKFLTAIWSFVMEVGLDWAGAREREV